MKTLIFTLVISFFFTAAYSLQVSAQGKTEKAAQTGQAKVIYTCPMHPKVESDKPGKCPECGMNLVAQDQKQEKMDGGMKMAGKGTSAGTITTAINMLKKAKKELADKGMYNCCIETPCDRCLIDHQNCSCAKEVKGGEAVCSDCYAGWKRGDGMVPGVDKDKVKMETHGHDHE